MFVFIGSLDVYACVWWQAGDVHQQEGENGAVAGAVNQHHRRQDPCIPTGTLISCKIKPTHSYSPGPTNARKKKDDGPEQPLQRTQPNLDSFFFEINNLDISTWACTTTRPS